MNKTFIRLLVTIMVLFLVYLSIVLIASIVQLAEAADRIYIGLGQPVFWVLVSLFTLFFLSPFVMYFRLPKALVPPDESTGTKHDTYMILLRNRLKNNPRLVGTLLESDEDVISAIGILSREVDKLIKQTASTVFVSTAVMQNGRIDGFITLVVQAKMVWQIATIYYQRPSPRQMLYLYSNVGGAALLAQSLDDIDFSEIVAPIVVSAIPSLKGAVPGLQGISNLLVNSLSSGATNAMITLRVGIVAKQYCEATSTPSRNLVRKNANLVALSLIGEISKENSKQIATSVWNAVSGITGDLADATVKKLKDAADQVAESTSEATKKLIVAMNVSAENLKNASKKAADTINESTVAASNNIVCALDSTVTGVKRSIEVALDSVKSGVYSTRQYATKVAESASITASNTSNKLGEIYLDAKEASKDLAGKVISRKEASDEV